MASINEADKIYMMHFLNKILYLYDFQSILFI